MKAQIKRTKLVQAGRMDDFKTKTKQLGNRKEC